MQRRHKEASVPVEVGAATLSSAEGHGLLCGWGGEADDIAHPARTREEAHRPQIPMWL